MGLLIKVCIAYLLVLLSMQHTFSPVHKLYMYTSPFSHPTASRVSWQVILMYKIVQQQLHLASQNTE